MQTLNKSRIHDAVLWEPTGEDRFREYEYATPGRAIKVRWLDEKSEALDPQGKTVKLDASAVVGEELVIGCLLAKGTVVDFENPLYQVITQRKRSDLGGRETKRTVGLIRYKDYDAEVMPGVRLRWSDHYRYSDLHIEWSN